MDNRERMRLYMAAQRLVRRGKGLCPRCGLRRVPLGRNCTACRRVRALKENVVSHLDNQPSTRVA